MVGLGTPPTPCESDEGFLTTPPRITPGIRPLTVVEPRVHVTLEEMANRVVATRAEHGDLLQRYHEVWYNAPHTWHYLHFLGIGVMKCPNDLWMYQELIAELKPYTIIETGTYQGGSALWFAFVQQMLGIVNARVITVDFEDHRRCDHPNITFLGGNSVDPELVADIRSRLPRQALHGQDLGYLPTLVVLDSDHSAEHVYAELCLYAPLVPLGSYLVVEDTNIAWHEDGGAREGLTRYLTEHPNEWAQDVLCERWLLTMNPGGWLKRIAPYNPFEAV